ncbi:hypothetical protein U0027_24160 (plasmid) [Agrobacterium tumefaciens]|uniref:hypothetical protein n=1 Tax=Agrobacterium tumefaciens TaxID=358 RepID=UPI001963A029|nr:hypothetical protein [Agrobacterium tumefaciens]WQE43646.1 hypothetical protein U0027_24160 [Agrobacterium tumefaciens]
MLKSEHELLTELKAALTNRQYSPVVIRNYCAYAQGFLDYLVHRGIPVAENDAADAEAIVETAICPLMRFVVPKTEKQQASSMIFRCQSAS